MKTRKKVQKSIDKNLRKMVLPTFDYISSCYKDHSIDLLSIDRVVLKSFSELNDLGKLYLCNTNSPFLCMTDLDFFGNNFKELKKEIVLERPITISIVSLSLIGSEENDNLIMLIFPKNSKRKSLAELVGLLETRDKLH